MPISKKLASTPAGRSNSASINGEKRAQKTNGNVFGHILGKIKTRTHDLNRNGNVFGHR